ncbi:RDD family protein [Desulfuromonas acetoxidans]|uniref:RDD family protein n=1 Tax=Desulfuromonas acetoxidans TaxID=891 RepID=UPI002930EC30|nr:RDD family protein [Desulfuromonas acetoxidans]
MMEREYAGFWVRSVATLIDMLILSIVTGIPLTIIYGQDYWRDQQMIHGFWQVMISYVFPLLATIWFWRRYRGTPGKMAFRLNVVDAQTGGALTVGQSVLRNIGYVVSALPMMLGYLWVGVDRRKQGFHDKMAGSVVVRELGKEPVRFEK